MKDENNYGDEILTICEFVAKKNLLSNKIITPNRLFLIITDEFFAKLCEIAFTKNPQSFH
jgi:hypothetical protein